MILDSKVQRSTFLRLTGCTLFLTENRLRLLTTDTSDFVKI